MLRQEVAELGVRLPPKLCPSALLSGPWAGLSISTSTPTPAQFLPLTAHSPRTGDETGVGKAEPRSLISQVPVAQAAQGRGEAATFATGERGICLFHSGAFLETFLEEVVFQSSLKVEKKQ